MKNVSLKAVLALMSLASVSLQAEDKLENKIKVVNLQSLAMESAEGSLIMKQLQELAAKLEAEAKQIMAELQKIDKDIEDARAKSPAAGIATTEKKIRDLEYKKAELQSKLQRLMQDGRNDLGMEEMRLTQPLFNSLVEVISQWAKEHDLYLVLDETSGRPLYKKDGLDATKDVMTLANKKYEQKMVMAKNHPASAKPVAKTA